MLFSALVGVIGDALCDSEGRYSGTSTHERIFTLACHSDLHVRFNCSWLVKESLVAEGRIVVQVGGEERATDKYILARIIFAAANVRMVNILGGR